MGELQHSPDIRIAELVKRIQVHTEGAREQHRILHSRGQMGKTPVGRLNEVFKECLLYLWYDCESASEVMQANSRDIYIVNEDMTFSSFYYPEETVGQAGFSCSCASNNANLNTIANKDGKK